MSNEIVIIVISSVTLSILVVMLIGNSLNRILTRVKNLSSRKNYISIKRQIALRIAESTRELSAQKLGALIVVQKQNSLANFVNLGVIINSDVNVQLILAIFQKNSPLHDGAIIIDRDKIISASSYLPTTNKKISSKYGSRHRAAIGLSEQYDALPIVVSETTGQISYATKGTLIAVDDFMDLVNVIYRHIGYSDSDLRVTKNAEH
ncbi:hypothetical protein ASO20_01255 [Mycoplasma sp. (ex Biomphalaria glabrata)]|uniref:diadenylate cyclase n=1 Tax=Mycoplasma sp. (ex Biomphalaria glabrata) TaxID=1749074 RepID=UPI00073A81CA|nr:DNA integrity scanning protein DisA nucleotide-binding domain protein [Mycoplasma sp. (ex Biomphalaria glabrata)]ALV23284.1 hypothetical protein ASO20_01255 [Mycoplasma sp. (ex Biomphalaria glabrata)]